MPTIGPKRRVCKDCRIQQPGGPRRDAPYPGPRCATHHRAERKRLQMAAHSRMTVSRYALTSEDYLKLYAFQGGFCAICWRATGKVRRLAVDHDHKTGGVRGLLCGPCNQMVGRARDSPALFERAAAYLRLPPFDRMGGSSQSLFDPGDMSG